MNASVIVTRAEAFLADKSNSTTLTRVFVEGRGLI